MNHIAETMALKPSLSLNTSLPRPVSYLPTLRALCWGLCLGGMITSCSQGVVTSRSPAPEGSEVPKDHLNNDPESEGEDDSGSQGQDESEETSPDSEGEGAGAKEDISELSDSETSPVDSVNDDGEAATSDSETGFITIFQVKQLDEGITVEWNLPEDSDTSGIKDYQYQIEGDGLAWQSMGHEGSFTLTPDVLSSGSEDKDHNTKQEETSSEGEGLGEAEEQYSSLKTVIVRVLYENGPGENHVISLDQNTLAVHFPDNSQPTGANSADADANDADDDKDPTPDSSMEKPSEVAAESNSDADSSDDREDSFSASDDSSPTRMIVTFFVDVGSESIGVGWDVSDGPAEPKILNYQYRIHPAEKWHNMLPSGPRVNSDNDSRSNDLLENFFITGLEPSTDYTISFRVIYEDVPSLNTTMEITTHELTARDREPLPITLEAKSTELTLHWLLGEWFDEDGGEDFEYRIVELNSEKWQSLGTSGTYVIDGLSPNTKYHIEIRVRYRDGLGRATRIPFTTSSE